MRASGSAVNCADELRDVGEKESTLRDDVSRKNYVGLCVVAALCLSMTTPSTLAQTSTPAYPKRTVTIVVGFSPGGGTDVTSRMLAQKLTSEFGQSVVVVNRAGASGSIAAETVAKSPADGYTLLMVASATIANAALRTDLPFSLERDFAPISLVTEAPLVLLVHPSLPVHTVKELVALARTKPGTITYGSDGIGSSSHLAGELFSSMANVKLVHVPFKGGSDSAVATASAQILINFPSIPAALPLIKAGKFNVLAVTTPKRSSFMPTVPTLDESGLPGYDVPTWYGLITPAATPKPIITQVHAAVVKIVGTSEVTDFIHNQGMEPQANTPEQFAAFMRAQTDQYAKVGKLANIKLE